MMKISLKLICFLLCIFIQQPLLASSICHQGNIALLSSTYPKIKALINRHEKEQEALEKRIEFSSGQSEAELDEDLQTEKKLTELDSLITKEFKEMAQRQYAEFWELCSEITE